MREELIRRLVEALAANRRGELGEEEVEALIAEVEEFLARPDCSREHTGIYSDEMPHR